MQRRLPRGRLQERRCVRLFRRRCRHHRPRHCPPPRFLLHSRRSKVFRPVQRAALNTICEPYTALLLAADSAALLEQLGAQGCALALPDPGINNVGPDDDPDDYAAGW